jgi:hypothetical protein
MQLEQETPQQVVVRCQGAGLLEMESLEPFQGDLKSLSDREYQKLRGRILDNGFTAPIHVWRHGGKNFMLDGHQRLRTLQKLKAEGFSVPAIPVDFIEADSYARAKRILLSHASQYGKVEGDGLYQQIIEADIQAEELLGSYNFHELDMEEFVDEFLVDGEGGGGASGTHGSLSEKFVVPPFSVLDARQGYWKERKEKWLALGIRSELGRGEVMDTLSSARKAQKNGSNDIESWVTTSVFDPVLCEIAYRWFSPSGGTVIDPFAGGSVRGVVASRLGRQYLGVELREEQVKANRDQGDELCQDYPMPVWKCGDSRDLHDLLGDVTADLIFSCPPYADLERYSDDPRDLSTLEYPAFLAAYRDIIGKAVSLLRQDRFAFFVVGEVRGGKHGFYYNFVQDTIAAFRAAGAEYYNEGIFVTPIGSLPVRAGRVFSAGRKLGKTHQNILVFCKGDPKVAAEACGQVVIDESAFKAGVGAGE